MSGSICGCSFVHNKLKKKKLTKKDLEEIREHVFNIDNPCYWCGYDLEERIR